MLACDGQWEYPFVPLFSALCWNVDGKEVWGTRTYSAVAITENTYLGTATSGGMQVCKHMPKEYIVGALFPVTLKLTNTIKTFPNVPTG